MTEAADTELMGLEGPFDEQAARQALHDMVRRQGRRSVQGQTAPITAWMQALLDQPMPRACFVLGRLGPNAPYIPAWLIKEAANLVFGDRWSSETLAHDTLRDDTTTLDLNGRVNERRVHRIIVSARVRVTVRAPGGRVQAHDGLGVSGYDIPLGSPDYMSLYRIAHKGAETDAIAQALSLFGRLFTARGGDSDTVHEQAEHQKVERQRRSPKPARRLARGPAAKTEFRLFDEHQTELLIAEDTAKGAYEWMDAYQELLGGIEEVEALDRLRAHNARVEEEVRAKWGQALDDRFLLLDRALDEAVARSVGMGGPPARKGARRSSKDRDAGTRILDDRQTDLMDRIEDPKAA